MLIEVGEELATRLLIVDDDDVDREKIIRCLRKIAMPISILNAASGQEALELHQTFHKEIDLMLLDYHLGDMTGTELLAELKSLKNGMTPTIMITGNGNERSAVEAMKLGAVDYLVKSSLTESTLLTVLKAAIEKAELAVRYKRTQEELKRKSLYDSLTGLANRELILDRLNQSIAFGERHKNCFYMLVVDLNGFKHINDSFGHLIGDEVLRQISEKMSEICRKSDTVGRFGGDEFIIILPEIETDTALMVFLEKLLACIATPISTDQNIIIVGASVGIGRYPDHGKDCHTLLSNADDAMYEAKRNNQSYVFYHGHPSNEISAFVNTQSLLRAIENKEFFLTYQPKVDSTTYKLKSVEALVRWQSAECGLIMPNDFIPFAERSNFIGILTDEVLRIALDQAQQWQDEGVLNFKIALNISAKTLDNADFKDILMEQVSSRGLSPSHFILEITETALASSRSGAQKQLSSLIDLGFQISIDDFGTGFTSFKYIRDIEISEIKIDRLFIKAIEADSRDMQIVSSIISLGKNLGIATVAEGVETDEQMLLLKEVGCTYIQGYGIAKPMMADDFMAWNQPR